MEKTMLQCVYDTHKSFYNKAYYTKEEGDEKTYYKLYSYNTEVLTIVIDNNDITKSYYICNNYTAYSNTTLQHVKEFLHQVLTTKVNVYDILCYIGFTKDNILKLTRYNKTLQQYLADTKVK